MKKTIIISSLAIFVLSGCFGGGNQKQEWTALIYPDKNNTKRSKKHGIYPTLEECKKESLLELERLELSSRGDYQCGLNCTYNEGAQMEVCEKLSK
ncbi:hypothetical protein CRV08_00385 [Halarcobacter ebronensis]|uniref:Lipoprotein n=1 Tax=Halarcobacter ebronensis TaxID=1462615 RepID=A0A4Q0YIF5_9BACT|nr:hypothetical protein [Halarcobacter ebronensis]RXJ70055.1 hypothetical protein CRV08_00385 [Halarcobacter ebronensis]